MKSPISSPSLTLRVTLLAANVFNLQPGEFKVVHMRNNCQIKCPSGAIIVRDDMLYISA